MNISKHDINAASRDLQLEIWRKRNEFCWRPYHYEELFTPENGASVLGINLVIFDQLPSFGNGSRYETAGLVERLNNKIALSSRFSLQEMRFTGGHELGHWQLHPEMNAPHRDRPINRRIFSFAAQRDPKEAEADYFAACFLMPERPVVEAFERTFKKAPLILNDLVAYALNPQNHHDLLRSDINSFAYSVAASKRFNGSQIFSLAEQFNVTISAMAYRLLELKLVQI